MCATLPTVDRLERIEALTFADEYEAAPPEIVEQGGLGFEWIDGTLAAWASRVDVLMFNRAIGIGQQSPATEASVRAIAECFDRAGVSRSFLQIAPGANPAGLADWLEPNGYSPYNRWAKLARPLIDLPPLSERVRIDVIGPERAADFGRVLADAFRMPPAIETWESTLVGRPRWRHYLAYVDDTPVGCAALFVAEGLASLGQAGTLEAARGRGVQGALIAKRLSDAAAVGCTHAVVETAEDTAEKPAPSFRNQLRHGFELCYFRSNYLRVRPPAPR
jgi:GNAT superfamily N-acetyltransferase